MSALHAHVFDGDVYLTLNAKGGECQLHDLETDQSEDVIRIGLDAKAIALAICESDNEEMVQQVLQEIQNINPEIFDDLKSCIWQM